MDPITTALSLIIRFFFDAYTVVLILRFILQKLGASWHNPIVQFLIKLTQKPLIPFKKVTRGVKGFDFSIVLLALIVQLVETYLLILLATGSLANILGAIVLSIAQLAIKTLYVYIFAIIISAIASWVPTIQQSPVFDLVDLLTAPINQRIRKVIPPIAGIDLSPMFAILCLYLINILFLSQLQNWAIHLL